MNFLNVGPWELTVILVIAILMIGPKRLMEIIRAIGRITAQMRKLSSEFMGTIQTELRIAELETPQAAGGGAGMGTLASLPDELRALGRETRQAVSEIVAGTESIVTGEREAAEGERDG